MNPVCDVCEYQATDNRGSVQCGRAKYTYNDNYGPFKGGAVCKHDSDLGDHFNKVESVETNKMREMSTRVESWVSRAHKAEDECRVLRNRLIRVEGDV